MIYSYTFLRWVKKTLLSSCFCVFELSVSSQAFFDCSAALAHSYTKWIIHISHLCHPCIVRCTWAITIQCSQLRLSYLQGHFPSMVWFGSNQWWIWQTEHGSSCIRAWSHPDQLGLGWYIFSSCDHKLQKEQQKNFNERVKLPNTWVLGSLCAIVSTPTLHVSEQVW